MRDSKSTAMSDDLAVVLFDRLRVRLPERKESPAGSGPNVGHLQVGSTMALLTRICRLPISRTVVSTACCTSAADPTSHFRPMAFICRAEWPGRCLGPFHIMLAKTTLAKGCEVLGDSCAEPDGAAGDQGRLAPRLNTCFGSISASYEPPSRVLGVVTKPSGIVLIQGGDDHLARCAAFWVSVTTKAPMSSGWTDTSTARLSAGTGSGR